MRACNRCGIEKDESEYYGPYQRAYYVQVMNTCKRCTLDGMAKGKAARAAERDARRQARVEQAETGQPLDKAQYRHCRVCGHRKRTAEMYSYVRKATGRLYVTNDCKPCKAQVDRDRRAKHRADRLALSIVKDNRALASMVAALAPEAEALDRTLIIPRRKGGWKGRLVEAKRAVVRDLLAVGCSICGYRELPALDFHHLVRSEKQNSVSRMVTSGNTVAALLREVAKCVVLCANCHRVIEAREQGSHRASRSPLSHGRRRRVSEKRAATVVLRPPAPGPRSRQGVLWA